MGTRRTYTPEQRREALELYREHGPAEAARRCGIASGTIRQWALKSGLTSERAKTARANVEALRLTWAQRRGEICVRAGEVASNMLEEAAAAGNSRKARDFMGAFEIGVRTAQLLDGAPTERVASEVELREQVHRMRDELAARRVVNQ